MRRRLHFVYLVALPAVAMLSWGCRAKPRRPTRRRPPPATKPRKSAVAEVKPVPVETPQEERKPAARLPAVSSPQAAELSSPRSAATLRSSSLRSTSGPEKTEPGTPGHEDVPSVEQWTPAGGRSRKLFDESTLLQNWAAARLAGVDRARIVTVTPAARGRNCKLTGEKRPPARTVRCSQGDPVFELDFGTLDISCYVVRVIALVETGDIEQYRKPVDLEFTVNDRPGGGESLYRHRVPYWDDFYCVADFFFNADERRVYRGGLTLGEGSLADLHVHNIEFHDALRDLPRKAAKRGPSLFTLAEREQLRKNSDAAAVRKLVKREVPLDSYLSSPRPEGAPSLGPEQRRKRDEILWSAFPPVNSQYIQEYDQGWVAGAMRPGRTGRKEFEEKHGRWEFEGPWKRGWHTPLVLVNKKLGVRYTRDDLADYRPLPDPYPFKDPLGTYFPQEEGMEHAEHWLPIARELGLRWEAVQLSMSHYHGGDYKHHVAYLYHALADERAARDAALILCKWAHVFPTYTDDQLIGHAVMSPGFMYKRDNRLLWRRFGYYRPINLYLGLLTTYDYLFDYIEGNEALARAVGRFIPWVKTDRDVRRLIETRILQLGAKRVMRFHYWTDKGTPAYLMQTALVQQDPEITRPWMEFLWTNTYVYPNPRAGVPDYISTATQRDGTTKIGSVFYTQGGSAFLSIVKMSRRYVANGGDPKFDLSNLELYRKIVDGCVFPLDSNLAGGFPVTVGDVGAPAKPRMISGVSRFDDQFRTAWSWTGEERFAWIMKHYLGRKDEQDEEWRAIERAAEEQGRNPFLAQRSRVMASWAGILESGQDSDDYRFKRTVYMRVGTGHGHAHADTLDLQLVAHGCRMLNDIGWRGAYSTPRPSCTILHNRVEVNGKTHPFREGSWQGHSWIDTFKPMPGAQYMRGTAVPPAGRHSNVKHYSRAVALIDVDEGVPARRPPSTPVYHGGKTRHDPKVVAPTSYVFDVQRVSGGRWHTFCFHGNWSDDFEVKARKRRSVGQGSVKPVADESVEAMYLRKFLDSGMSGGQGLKWAGEAEDTVTATWRLRRAEDVIEGTRPHSGQKASFKQSNAEKIMLGADYDDRAPRKYTKLHLFGRRGERVMVGSLTPHGERSRASWPFLMVSKMNEEAKVDSVYPAIIEAYAGEPFIASARLLDVRGNEKDALRAVALEVKTKNGRTDLCFSDGRGRQRKIGNNVNIAARFVYLSGDRRGFRLAYVVDGTEISSPQVSLRLARTAYETRVVRVDYLKRRVWLEAKLPACLLAGEQLEIGNDLHKTSYTVVAAADEREGTVVTLDKAIDLSYAHVRAADPAKREVDVNLGPNDRHRGMDAGLTCTNGDMTKHWKCRILGPRRGQGYVYRLEGSVTERDFPIGSVFRLWEFGPGDRVRLPAHCHLIRAEDAPGEYIMRANVHVTVSLPGKGRIQVSDGRGGWRTLKSSTLRGKVIADIRVSDMPRGIARLRVSKWP